MISPELRARAACPVCLEPFGCARCTRPAGHAGCTEYPARAACGCGGPDKVALREHAWGLGDEAGQRREAPDAAHRDPLPGRMAEAGLGCPCCGTVYAGGADAGYLDLMPPQAAGAETLYDDHEFQERLRVSGAPPLLSARVKADMMASMLGLEAGQRVLDLGCGAGKMALFAGGRGARPAGVDAAPFFLPAAARSVDLARADLRRLPFRKGSFEAAWSIDVLEHLDEAGVADLLVEARRVLAPGGALFVYTHAMESSRLAAFQRAVNRLARRLGRAGLLDHEREAMRKADHRNPLRTHEHFDALCAAAGLVVRERRYYNVVLKALVEDLGLRMVEQVRRRRTHGHEQEQEHGPQTPLMPGRLALAVGGALTWLLKLDVVLFGGIRTGPFFARLEARAPDPAAR